MLCFSFPKYMLIELMTQISPFDCTKYFNLHKKMALNICLSFSKNTLNIYLFVDHLVMQIFRPADHVTVHQSDKKKCIFL
jgi:hypothetical protein